MDSIELSSILDCFGDQITIKSTNTYTIWLEMIGKVLNMLIELKGNNYYSKVFKRFNYKLQNNTFWVVIKGLSHNKNGGQNTLKLKLPSRTGSQLADKKSETLIENSSQNKELHKISSNKNLTELVQKYQEDFARLRNSSVSQGLWNSSWLAKISQGVITTQKVLFDSL